jgi:predicted nucleotidyltransferase
MMKFSLDLTNKPELGTLSDLIAAIRAKAPKTDILLVGATARDLLLFYAHGIKAVRGTEDIDLALAVDNWNVFERLHKSLLSSKVFQSHSSGMHKLLYRKQITVDLIPFGGIEDADGTISWPPNGDTVMSVLGFREALESSIEVLLPSNLRIAVVSLPMLVVLKILSWAERRVYAPRKDAFDLMLILHNYLDAGNSERLYEEEAQLLDDPGFDYEFAGAWLAGKDAADIIKMHSKKANRIEDVVRSILTPEIDPDGPLHLIAELKKSDPERSLKLMTAFLSGFSMGRK